jgi:hypothetical protein
VRDSSIPFKGLFVTAEFEGLLWCISMFGVAPHTTPCALQSLFNLMDNQTYSRVILSFFIPFSSIEFF